MRELLLHRSVELPQQLALLLGQIHRRLDDDAAEQIAVAPPRTGFTPFSRSRNTRPDWVSRRHLELDVAVERRHFDRAAERRGDEADRHFARQMTAVALEDRVLANADLDVQIARRAAVAARFAFARQPDAIAVVDALRHLDRERLLAANAALPQAACRRAD